MLWECLSCRGACRLNEDLAVKLPPALEQDQRHSFVRAQSAVWRSINSFVPEPPALFAASLALQRERLLIPMPLPL